MLVSMLRANPTAGRIADFTRAILVQGPQLLNDVISLIQLRLTDLVRRRLRLRPRLTDAARLRLALLLYSHLTEVDAVAVYETLANLVKITTGKALHDGPVRRPLQTAKGSNRLTERMFATLHFPLSMIQSHQRTQVRSDDLVEAKLRAEVSASQASMRSETPRLQGLPQSRGAGFEPAAFGFMVLRHATLRVAGNQR